MGCKGCSTSNNEYERCPNVTTTNCVKYMGDDIPCLEVCKGDVLTDVQVKFLEKLCEIVGEVDMSNIVLPSCLVTAWGTQDKNILNFVTFLLEQNCILQSQITSLNNNINNLNPIVSVDWKCIEDSPCAVTTIVTMEQAFQNIIDYVCSLSTQVTTLEESISTINSQIAAINSTQNLFTLSLNSIAAQTTNLQVIVDCLNQDGNCP